MKDLMKLKKAELVEKLNTAYADINALQKIIGLNTKEIDSLMHKINDFDTQLREYKRRMYVIIAIAIVFGIVVGSLI